MEQQLRARVLEDRPPTDTSYPCGNTPRVPSERFVSDPEQGRLLQEHVLCHTSIFAPPMTKIALGEIDWLWLCDVDMAFW